MTLYLFDMSGGVLIFALLLQGGLALAAAIAIFLVITFVEAIVLRFINWGDMWQSLFDSLVINFITTIVGIMAAITAFGFLDAVFGLPDTLGELLPQMILLWAITILIEGILLGVIRKRSFNETWGASLIINTCSYLMLAVIIPLLGFSTYL